MRSATSLAAAIFTLTALALSTTATPLQARQAAFSLTCPDDPASDAYVASIPESGQSTLQGWCTSLAVSMGCDATGNIIYSSPDALKDTHCDPCSCAATVAAPVAPAAAAPPTCTGSMKLLPAVQPGTTPPSLQNWCTRPAVDTVCNPGVTVQGVDTENVCLSACTCPS